MKNIIKILILILISLINNGCASHQISDSEIETRALKIVNQYDSTNIEIFKTWSYTPRGENGIWFKNSGDSTLYSCIYHEFKDSTKLYVIRHKNFIDDFGVNIPYDTSYWRINFVRQSNEILKIIGVNNHGMDVLLKERVSVDSLFNRQDPFVQFEKLTELRDSLKFISVSYYERLGGFIQFYLILMDL